MDRPYIVCHVLSALDGKIAGTKAAQAVSKEYARIRSAYRADAWLYGTTTTKEFTQYRKPVLEPAFEDIPDGDYIAETELGFYYISLDTAEEIGCESGIFQKPGRPDAHVIEITGR